MREELKKLWLEYVEYCEEEENKYFQRVLEEFGPALYSPNKKNIPSFEGFIKYILSPLEQK